ncbi:aldo/keto reductase [Archangium violaceum]|nr:aldo/keto reductase [Archangium violaceum]
MRYMLLGRRTGIRVSNLILGTGVLGKAGGYGAEPADVRAILRGYAEAGGNFIDTSDAYQQGQSEIAIGEFIAANRDDFVIASKYSRSAMPDPGVAALGAHRKAMVQSVEASLKRLETDRIDLYLVHMDDGVTPVEEIARGFDDLVRAGKILYGGFSNMPAWRISTAAATANLRGWAPIAAIQVEYSLLQRTTEHELLPMADELGLGVMAYSPLAGGLLTGKYRKGETGRVTSFKGSVAHEDAGGGATVIDAVLAVADETGATPGQVAIAWVMARGVHPIIGPRTHTQLEENLAAATLELSADQLRRLNEVSSVPGGYPHELLAVQRTKLMAAR